jgi:hypothetical protein
MLKTFFKTALRKILKTKTHAAINILGLSIGMACAIIIFLFVQHELSYDHFHAPADRIYRLNYDETVSRPNGRYMATTSPPMGPALVQTYPEVEKFVRLRFSDGDVMASGEKRFFENSVIYADSSFFEVFAFPLQLGDPKTALAAPNAAVLTPAMAEKYFGDENPLGRTLEMNNELTLNVTGVLQDEPAHSHLDFDFLELLGVELLQGRFFSEAFASDAREAIVINKSAAQMLGWQDPIGRRLRIGSLVDGRVIGVAEDFHYASLHHEVAPLAIFVADLVENVYIKLRPGNLPVILTEIENAWRQIAPDQPFDVTFLDAHLQTLYESDRRFSKLVYAFSGLATFIACIGLFGLATYTSRQRTREIGPAFPYYNPNADEPQPKGFKTAAPTDR